MIKYLLYLLPLCAIGQTITGKVIHVHDGDTFTMITENSDTVKTRLAMIDCPELAQPFGYEAKNRVAGILSNKQVMVDVTGTDRYGRIIGIARTETDTINYLLLREGLAWHYRRYDQSTYAADLEWQAKRHRLGIWNCALAPWDWRAMARKNYPLKKD
jgi:micrococcal nuclease